MSESFAELFEESLKTVDMSTGSIVTGEVVDIDNEWVKKLSKKYLITLKKQIGESLCSRMQNCLLSESALGGKTLLIGTDIPALSEKSISEAIKKLNNNDIVIGPTYDEGFYLIGSC